VSNGVRVLEEQCGTCIFRPGNLMHLRPGRLRDIVGECRHRDTHVPCHEFLTLPRGGWVAGPKAQGAVCRGYFDSIRPLAGMLQVADRLGFIEYVPCP
jgi:hypothetical protein